MAAKSGEKPFEMVQCDDISNWLEDIFDAAAEGVITSPETCPSGDHGGIKCQRERRRACARIGFIFHKAFAIRFKIGTS